MLRDSSQTTTLSTDPPRRRDPHRSHARSHIHVITLSIRSRLQRGVTRFTKLSLIKPGFGAELKQVPATAPVSTSLWSRSGLPGRFAHLNVGVSSSISSLAAAPAPWPSRGPPLPRRHRQIRASQIRLICGLPWSSRANFLGISERRRRTGRNSHLSR